LSALGSGSVIAVEIEMDRTKWTDERIEERFNSIDQRLGRIETELRDLRTLMYQLWGTNMIGILVTLVAVVIRT
jgi:hypothetical protein